MTVDRSPHGRPLDQEHQTGRLPRGAGPEELDLTLAALVEELEAADMAPCMSRREPGRVCIGFACAEDLLMFLETVLPFESAADSIYQRSLGTLGHSTGRPAWQFDLGIEDLRGEGGAKPVWPPLVLTYQVSLPAGDLATVYLRLREDNDWYFDRPQEDSDEDLRGEDEDEADEEEDFDEGGDDAE
jgi:hypothetical protein